MLCSKEVQIQQGKIGMLIKSKHSEEADKASILVRGVDLLNNIDEEIKNSETKKCLKNHIPIIY